MLEKSVEIVVRFEISHYALALVLKVPFERAAPLAFTKFRHPCSDDAIAHWCCLGADRNGAPFVLEKNLVFYQFLRCASV